MADDAHIWTDEQIAALERRIFRTYKDAAEELKETIEDYFEKFKARDAKMRAKLLAGEITEEEYKLWRVAQIGRGERFEALRDRIAERYTSANETTVAYINDQTPSIYSLNRNFTAYTIEQVHGNVGFNLWDESTVRRLIVEQPNLMPYYPEKLAVKRGIDLDWGKKQITASITSSILQGKNLKRMADDLQARMQTMNRDSAIRTARTAYTTAQNAGRQDAFVAAEKMGIRVRKRWIATKDNRTRHDHGAADGQTVEADKPFDVGGYPMMFPGDSEHGAPGRLIYNCRCTMRTVEKEGIEQEPRKIRVRDPETGENKLINEMTYAEWAGWKEKNNKNQPVFATTRDEAYKVLESVGFSEVGKSIQYIDDDTIIRQANQMLALNSKFGAIRDGHTGHIGAENSKKFVATTRGSFTNPEGQSLILSFDSYAHGIEHLTAQEKKAVLSGWSMPCLPENYAVYTVTHEYGHILENSIIHDMVDFSALSEKLSKVGTNVSKYSKVRKDEAKRHAQTIYREILDIAKENDPSFSLKTNISDYGKTDYFEAFAETFANSQLGMPNQLGKAMQEWLRRRGYDG